MQTENFETKILDDKFKHSIKILITNNDKKLDVVDLKTTQQAKLLLDFFNNNRFILAGLVNDTTKSPIETIIFDINSGRINTQFSKNVIKIAKELLFSSRKETCIKNVTDSHYLLKDVLSIAGKLETDGLGCLIEKPTKVKNKIQKVSNSH